MTDSEFSTALQSLGSQLAASDIESAAYYAVLVRLLHARFHPSRVNVWRLRHTHEGSERLLECVAEFDPERTHALRRDTLTDDEFSPYLHALARDGVFVSSDALADPALAAMRASYLEPGNVRALMDAAITINGTTVGVVCCEEIGRTREWRRPEVTALMRSIATVNIHLARLQGAETRAGELPH